MIIIRNKKSWAVEGKITFGEMEEDGPQKHIEEIDDYPTICFEELSKDNYPSTLLSSLLMTARVKDKTGIADSTVMSRK